MNLETKIIIYKFTPQVFTLTQKLDIQTVVQLVQWVQRLFCFTHMCLCTLLHNAYIIYIHACVR